MPLEANKRFKAAQAETERDWGVRTAAEPCTEARDYPSLYLTVPEPNPEGIPRKALFRSAKYIKLAENIGQNGNRAELTESLIEALGLLPSFDVVDVVAATRGQLQHFHSSDFVDAIQNSDKLSQEDLECYGLVDDCPAFDELFELVCLGAARPFRFLSNKMRICSFPMTFCCRGWRLHSGRRAALTWQSRHLCLVGRRASPRGSLSGFRILLRKPTIRWAHLF